MTVAEPSIRPRQPPGQMTLAGAAPALASAAAPEAETAILVEKLSLWYGDFQALFDVDLRVRAGAITALIGPSGCGKTTLLRSVNRINERLPYVRTEGSIRLWGLDVYAPEVELAQLRRQVGMVFQRPNPLPLSVRDNVLFGTRVHLPGGRAPSRGESDQIVEEALRGVLLWDELKDFLDRPGTQLSLEQQQKLCIARLLPVKPRLLLMDEPCSALDPAGTEAVEELIWKLRGDYTILIVTHNMAQARRATDECVFMLLGKMVEHSDTASMFLKPANEQTAAYIEGRYG